MIIDVSDILKETGGRIEIDGRVQPSDIEFLGERYSFADGISVKGSAYNNGKSITLRAVCKGEAATRCARCLKEIKVPVNFGIEENLVKDTLNTADNSEIVLFHDPQICIDDIIVDNFLMNTEGKYLCSDDCKGLCPQCGRDLNSSECGCEKEYIDPRWETLVAIMNKKD